MHDDKFEIDERLSSESFKLIDLKLSRVLLMDNVLFPWLILIPRKQNLTEIIDLNTQERMILMEEISLLSDVLMKVFSPDKLNVAALGNIVPQLHVHIIARYKNDIAWPESTFGKAKKAYTTAERLDIMDALIKLLSAHQFDG